MIFVWIETVRKVSASGSCCKTVSCEGCGKPYSYEVSREVTAGDDSLFSWTEEASYRKAEVNARKSLEKALGEAIEPVECPNCGWLQRAMVLAVRKAKHPQLYSWIRLGMLLTVAGFLLAACFAAIGWFVPVPAAKSDIFNPITIVGLMIAGLFGVPTFYLWLLRFILCRAYDPNANPRPDGCRENM
jgi:hypothetical protein